MGMITERFKAAHPGLVTENHVIKERREVEEMSKCQKETHQDLENRKRELDVREREILLREFNCKAKELKDTLKSFDTLPADEMLKNYQININASNLATNINMFLALKDDPEHGPIFFDVVVGDLRRAVQLIQHADKGATDNWFLDSCMSMISDLEEIVVKIKNTPRMDQLV